MIKLKTDRILIPIDFSKTSLRAIKHGAFMAKFLKGELFLLHVQKKSELLDIIMPAVKLKDISVITDFLQEKLDKMAEEVRKEYGIKVRSIVSTGNITSEIVSIAEENKIGMIVMGTQGKDSNNDLFLGSNSYRVLTKSPVPVMTVRDDVSKKIGYTKIVLPIDSSDHSRQKVPIAIDMADKFAAQLHVLCLLNPNEENYEYKMEVIGGQIEKLAAKRKVKTSVEIVYAKNKAKKTIDTAKKQKADLIITMTDQSAEFSSIVLGTYAHQLINHARIPVLCIKPEIHEENITNTMGGMF